MIINNLKQYLILMRFHKPIGILLLLWPTLWALWFAANGHPDYRIVSIFVIGVVLMRAAGCIINDIADRHVDAHVQRTKTRPLAAGTISTRAAIILFGILASLAFILVLQLNRLTVYLSIVGMLLAICYPFLKRVTHLPQVGLGAAFSWGVPMAYAAETNAVPVSAWCLFLVAIVWPVIYDTMYAMTDREDDIKIGIKSTAILFGKHDRLILGILQIIFVCGLAAIGFVYHMATSYYLSLILTAILFVYQQILMKHRDPKKFFQAFLNNNLVGLIIFAGIVWSYAK